MVLALKRAKRDEFGRPTITFTTSEIKKVMGRDDGSFYTQLKSVAKAMTGRTMFIEDKEQHSFKFINIIHTAEFENGKFTVNFTPEMNNYLDDLKSQYNILNTVYTGNIGNLQLTADLTDDEAIKEQKQIEYYLKYVKK